MALIHRMIILAGLSLFLGVSRATISCDFESDFCSWRQQTADHLDWERSALRTPDMTSGPRKDHTTGNGSFAFMSGSHEKLVNSTAELISPTLVMQSPVSSLSFWYHMNGIGIGSLRILILDPSESSRMEIWSRQGRQGLSWRNANVELPEGTYKLCISATARLHYGSDIAIDDVLVKGVFTELTTPPPTTTPQPVIDITEMKCNFDKNFCNWQQDSSDQLDWKRSSSISPDRTSGPVRDHTSGTPKGFYAFISGHEIRQVNASSRMMSPMVGVDVGATLKFWYHMNGHGIGSLTVMMVDSTDKEEVMFNLTGRQGPDWQEAVLNLRPGIYKLGIEATAKLHYGSDIAIDDITIAKNRNIIG